MAGENPTDWDNPGQRFHHLKYKLEDPQGNGCGGWRLANGLEAVCLGQMPAWAGRENSIRGEMDA